MITKEELIPMLYIGKDDDEFHNNTVYYVASDLDKDTFGKGSFINFFVFTTNDINEKSKPIRCPSYPSISEVLDNWKKVSDPSEKGTILILHNVYKITEILDALTCVKTVNDYYTSNFKINSVITKRINKSYKILRDIIIEKIHA